MLRFDDPLAYIRYRIALEVMMIVSRCPQSFGAMMTSDEMVEKGSAKKTGMHQESYKVDYMLEAKNKNTYIYAMQVL
ncbi:hypothetical protein BTUL_0064g00330 [Botrytis tulipae]|uniref:Uncharacterized protein n=1 Tax=Botrytis tulipae TaxID=87230 RepID=A0A4Z1ESD3_9HELO|nr:hypothetical protein BTUL_0064g00330 [Botrytis tulipae]